MNCSDKERLEIQARTAYDFLANKICNYDCRMSLIFLKRYIKSARNIDRTSFRIRDLKLGYYVFPLIIDMILKYSPRLLATKVFEENTLHSILREYAKFPCMLELSTGKQDNDKYAPEAFLRMAFNQLIYQERSDLLISRQIMLFIEIPKLYESKYHRLISILREILQFQFRVTLEDLIYCNIVLLVMGTEHDMIIEKLTSEMEQMKPYVESDAMKIVRNYLEITEEEYRIKARNKECSEYEFILYERFELHDHPIIRFGNKSIVPFPQLIINKLTRDIYSEFYKYVKENDKAGEYTNLYGNLIKDYIGVLFKQFGSNFQLVDLDVLFDDNIRKADWLLFRGNTGVIIECTAPKISDEFKRTGNLELLSQYIDENLAKKIDQCNETQMNYSGDLELVEKYGKINSWFKLIIMEEQIYFYNDLIKFLPNNPTAQKLAEQNIQIMSLLEFEMLVSSTMRSDILSILTGKYIENNRKISFDSYFGDLDGFDIDHESFLMTIFYRFFWRK